MPLVTVNPPEESTRVEKSTHVDLFLAGGISGCPDWQSEALTLLETALAPFPEPIVVANPRRAQGLEMAGPEAAAQIAWEHRMLARASLVSFWFPKETLCPITLLELGIEMGRGVKPLVVAAEHQYGRRFDLEEQLKMASHANPFAAISVQPSVAAMVEETVALLQLRG